MKTTSATALALSLLTGSALAQDPFQPGQRWVHPAPAASPWIPSGVTFGGADNLVWASAGGSNPRLFALDADGPVLNTPRAVESTLGNPIGALPVRAGRGGDSLFALRQVPAPDVFHRRTEITRHDPLAAAPAGQLAQVWSHELPLLCNGPARLDADLDGALVVAGMWDSTTGLAVIDFLAGSNGAVLHREMRNAQGLDALVVAQDGSRVAVTLGLDLFVFDGAGTQLFHAPLASATRALDLSGDGRLLALGGTGAIALFTETAGIYQPAGDIGGGASWTASRLALSRDGSTLAIGWWNHVSGVDLRLDVFVVPGLTLTNRFEQQGTPGGLQNLPQNVRVSDDGSRIALGSWGYGGPEPEVALFDRGSDVPVWSASLPGSVRGLALDRTGTRLAVAYKDAHANQFAATGGIRLFDTGERTLQLRAPAELGGTLALTARHPTGGNVFFLIGQRASPINIPGVTGTLHLARPSITTLFAVSGPNGRADRDYALPPDPALVGLTLSVQAAFRTQGGYELSDEVLDPLILRP